MSQLISEALQASGRGKRKFYRYRQIVRSLPAQFPAALAICDPNAFKFLDNCESAFNHGEFATIKNQAARSSHPVRMELAPEATAEEFSVVRREIALYLALENCDLFRKKWGALCENGFDQVVNQLPNTGSKQ